MDPIKSPAELTWNNILLETRESKILLNKVSGQINPGSMTALMGSSGAGKTTLLNVLAGRTMKNLNLRGSILINGKERDSKEWPHIMAYVNQTFEAYKLQSVVETLIFACKQRGFDDKKSEEKTFELINLLGLKGSKDTFVDNLSGGEKMRLSVGIELIGDPQVIFLDEPTSGLDSVNAVNILFLLKKLSEMGKTIIVTIHQPSFKMLQFFDKIYLMSLGDVIFDGKIKDCIDFFGNSGYPLPENTNPADHFLDTIALDYRTVESTQASKLKIEKLHKNWLKIEPDIFPKIHDEIKIEKLKKPLKIEIGPILRRNLSNFKRNSSYIKVKAAQRIFIAVLFSLTYFQINLKTVDVFTFRGIVTFLVINELFGISGPILNAFPQEIKIITRERQSGFYSGFEAYYGKFLSEFLSLMCFEIPYVTFVYWIVGLDYNFWKYITFLIILLAEITFGIALGLTVGTVSPTINTSQALGVTFSILFVLYSGGFSKPNDVPGVVRWLMWISPCQYAFRAAVQSQLDGIELNNIPGEAVVESFGLSGIGVWPSIIIIFGFTFIATLIGATWLHLKTKNRIFIEKHNKKIELSENELI